MSTFAGIKYAAVSSRRRSFQVSSEAINGRIQVRNIGGQRNEWTVTFPPLTREEFDPVWTLIDSYDGGIAQFNMSLPDPKRPGVYSNYTVRLANPVQEFGMRSDGLVEFEMDVVEVI